VSSYGETSSNKKLDLLSDMNKLWNYRVLKNLGSRLQDV